MAVVTSLEALVSSLIPRDSFDYFGPGVWESKTTKQTRIKKEKEQKVTEKTRKPERNVTNNKNRTFFVRAAFVFVFRTLVGSSLGP